MPDCKHRWPCDCCTCKRAIRPLGRLYGVSMGKGWGRTGTTKDCPIHDTCRGFTSAVRARRANGRLLQCPKHHRRDCPVSDTAGPEDPCTCGESVPTVTTPGPCYWAENSPGVQSQVHCPRPAESGDDR
jgi:hypothetical protein